MDERGVRVCVRGAACLPFDDPDRHAQTEAVLLESMDGA